jgi:2-polyprenyl-3-methyl-5-hydroxy-6-metoxy-1,4-benzoquinol methylase
LEAHYSQVRDNIYNDSTSGRIKTFNVVLNHIKEYKKTGRLLDIGCYTGLFMKLAIDQGWEAKGLEPSKWAAQIGERNYKLDIINGNTGLLKSLKDGFDLITMWDVIEHLSNPKEALQNIHSLLKNDGVFVLSTMRCQSLFYNLSGNLWPWFMRMHLYYFTEKTITRLLSDCGFRVINIRPYTHYIGLDYLSYKFSIFHSIMAKLAKNRLLKKVVFPVQLGDFMEVYAVKK